MATIILPGIGGSGEDHWQTLWERADGMTRFRPAHWDAPVLDDWLRALDSAISECAEPPLLVAHSLACLLVAHWLVRRQPVPIRGAFLVAVPDPAALAFPRREAATFCPVPGSAFPFPTLMIASQDDPYSTVDQAKQRAGLWNAGVIVFGSIGHINGASGLGEWTEGKNLLEAFRAGTARSERATQGR